MGVVKMINMYSLLLVVVYSEYMVLLEYLVLTVL